MSAIRASITQSNLPTDRHATTPKGVITTTDAEEIFHEIVRNHKAVATARRRQAITIAEAQIHADRGLAMDQILDKHSERSLKVSGVEGARVGETRSIIGGGPEVDRRLICGRCCSSLPAIPIAPHVSLLTLHTARPPSQPTQDSGAQSVSSGNMAKLLSDSSMFKSSAASRSQYEENKGAVMTPTSSAQRKAVNSHERTQLAAAKAGEEFRAAMGAGGGGGGRRSPSPNGQGAPNQRFSGADVGDIELGAPSF